MLYKYTKTEISQLDFNYNLNFISEMPIYLFSIAKHFSGLKHIFMFSNKATEHGNVISGSCKLYLIDNFSSTTNTMNPTIYKPKATPIHKIIPSLLNSNVIQWNLTWR